MSTRTLSFPTLALLTAAGTVMAQGAGDHHEFYLAVHVDPLERIVVCNRVASPDSAATTFGVLRDSLGRITELALFYFGNIDTRGTWSTMQIRYSPADTVGGYIERRSFHAPNGMPLTMGRFRSMEIRYRADGLPVIRSLLDTADRLTNDSAGVARTLYTLDEDGSILQQWYYNTGKLHAGTGSDSPQQFFGVMPPGTWFRRFRVDSTGALVREELMNFDKEPIPFPGGEYVRLYENDECGHPVRIRFASSDGVPATDSSGISLLERRYDRSGRVVEWKSFDLSGNLRGRRSDGVAGERLTFRAFDDVLVRTERFNEQGEPLHD